MASVGLCPKCHMAACRDFSCMLIEPDARVETEAPYAQNRNLGGSMPTLSRSSYTVATLEVPKNVFDLIADKLNAAGYGHAFMDPETIDLSGVALVPSDKAEPWHLGRNKDVAVGQEEFMPMNSCPKGVKVQLLNAGDVACYGTWDGKSTFWKGWCPLPRIPDSMKDPHRDGSPVLYHVPEHDPFRGDNRPDLLP